MIRTLNKNYAEEIVGLHKTAIFPLWKKSGRNYSVKEVKEYVNLVFDKGKVFGFFNENKMTGCVGIILDKKHGVGEVKLLLVNPKFQKRKIGKKLIRYIEKYAKGKVKKLKLDVLVKNKAVNFYEKLKYKKLAYIMEKKL